jgi:DNA polymerase-4
MDKNMQSVPWLRAIILVDMNAFFASVEQRDHPEWRGKPLGVTNGQEGTCIITCSYEARAYGVKTGMRLKEARQLCPQLMQVASRPYRYAEVSQQIMQALLAITPDMEIFSIDEAFLDVTHCQRLHGSPEIIGRMAQQIVAKASDGLLCSIGVSGDKTTAKYAAKLHKPNGFTVIPPWQAREQLAPILATELCGINQGVARFLAQYGAYTCNDVAKLPVSLLAKRFGNMGRRIWLMCQGLDPSPFIPR